MTRYSPILALREEHRTAITEHLGRAVGNGHRVLESLYEHPIISIHDVRALTGITFQSANTLVARLQELGIVLEFTGQARHRRFVHDSCIRLFDEPEPA